MSGGGGSPPITAKMTPMTIRLPDGRLIAIGERRDRPIDPSEVDFSVTKAMTRGLFSRNVQ